jgi:hypothetical protein
MSPAAAMPEQVRPLCWSDELGWSLLCCLADRDLGEPDAPGTSSRFQQRRDLLEAARRDDATRRRIVTLWREAHADVVAAADHAATEGLGPASVRLLEDFSPEAVLLALLTDEFDDGLELAQRFAQRVSNGSDRRVLLTLLGRLTGSGPAASPQLRVVVVGGHPRDECRLGPLFERSPFEVRWQTFEKKQGGGALERTVSGALRSADAAVIVTGLASHSLMYHARNCAQRRGIRWKCIHKATDKQLHAALKELFPKLTWDWSS